MSPPKGFEGLRIDASSPASGYDSKAATQLALAFPPGGKVVSDKGMMDSVIHDCEGGQGGRGGAKRQVRKADCVLGKVVLRSEVAWLRERVEDSRVPSEPTYGNYLGEEWLEIHAMATWSITASPLHEARQLGRVPALFGCKWMAQSLPECTNPCLCIVCLPFVPHRPRVGRQHRELGSLVGKLLQERVWETAPEWWLSGSFVKNCVMSADPFRCAGVRGVMVVTGSILTTISV